MFFAKLARFIAVLILAFGLIRTGIGIYVANIEPMDAREAARARYIGNKSSGQAIDRGIYTILFAVALGTVAGLVIRRNK